MDSKYGRLFTTMDVKAIVERAIEEEVEDERELDEIIESHGGKFPRDEPLFLLRGQDSAAADTIRDYHANCKAKRAGAEHMNSIGLAEEAFRDFARVNPSSVGVPD